MSASELTGAELAARPSRRGTWLPWAGVAGAGIVVAVGLAIKAATGGLGEALPPFVMSWGPAVNPLVVISLFTIAGALGVAPAIVARAPAGPVFAISVYALALALGLGVNLAHEGVRGWWAVFAPRGSQEGPYEYLTGFDALVHGIPYYIRNFAALFPYLPEHAKGNPPGPLIALDLLGIRTAQALAALCIGLGALTAPLAYDLGRLLGGPTVGEERGRVAALLTAFSPAVILFGVTSADYAFAALGMVAATLLVRRRPTAWIAGCAVAAFAAFFSWLLLAIPAWAVLLVLRRDGWRAAVRLGACAALAIVAFNGALHLAYGWDPFSAIRAVGASYDNGTSLTRPYAFWLFGSPTAWAVMIGLPITWYALRSLAAGEASAIAIWALVGVAAVLGVTGGETERIWLPFVPLACVAAAAAVPAGRLRPVLTFLVFQAIVVELLFFTVW